MPSVIVVYFLHNWFYAYILSHNWLLLWFPSRWGWVIAATLSLGVARQDELFKGIQFVSNKVRTVLSNLSKGDVSVSNPVLVDPDGIDQKLLDTGEAVKLLNAKKTRKGEKWSVDSASVTRWAAKTRDLKRATETCKCMLCGIQDKRHQWLFKRQDVDEFHDDHNEHYQESHTTRSPMPRLQRRSN